MSCGKGRAKVPMIEASRQTHGALHSKLFYFGLAVGLVIVQLTARFSAARDEEGDTLDSAVERLQDIEAEYGVAVLYKYDREKFFPASWLKKPVDGHGGQIDTKELTRLSRIIETFVSRYPKQVIKENLQRIYLVSDLQFFGKSYGATYTGRSIYLRTRNAGAKFSAAFLRARLHSEFSSILMKRHKFPSDEWSKLNPADFEYTGSGVEVLGQKGLYGQTDPLLEKGFLVRYSQSSMENDFNMISDWLFTRREELDRLCEKHAVLNSKCKLAIEFYEGLEVKF